MQCEVSFQLSIERLIDGLYGLLPVCRLLLASPTVGDSPLSLQLAWQKRRTIHSQLRAPEPERMGLGSHRRAQAAPTAARRPAISEFRSKLILFERDKVGANRREIDKMEVTNHLVDDDQSGHPAIPPPPATSVTISSMLCAMEMKKSELDRVWC
jgi:hypothetical protein